LARVAVGLIWVLVLFATHMAVPMVWRQDVEDGSLEQLCLAGFPLEWIVLSKVLCVWLLTFGSLFMLLPFICVVMGMDALSVWVVMKAFFLVSLPLSFLTVTGGLMTQGRSRSAILSIIILLPLYLPLLIFSCGAGDAARLGQECGVYLTILAGLSLVMAPMLLYANVILLRWRPE
jgi:heme exporter protein B